MIAHDQLYEESKLLQWCGISPEGNAAIVGAGGQDQAFEAVRVDDVV